MPRCTASRSIAYFAVAFLPLALTTAERASATSVCERLNSRLAELSRDFTPNANLSEFTGAISRQNIEIRRAKNERRRLGCSRGSIIVIDDTAAACADLDDIIVEMEDNLRELKAYRQQLVSNGNEDARRRIHAAMELNGCLEAQWDSPEQDDFAGPEEAESQRNILKDLPPDSEAYPLLSDDPAMQDYSWMEGSESGQFRTMCVRTCDGAFFPISSNSTPADFARDAELCRSRCPDTETELYYHVLETEESDQMVSASTGRPYSELPTAFAYRTRAVGTPGICGCQAQKTATSVIGRGSEARLSAASPSVLSIEGAQPKKGTGAPAGTEASRSVQERPYDPKNSKVRVVGPTFLPREESAIDLKNPRGPRYQPLQEE